MFAAKRKLKLRNGGVIETPLLLPSFSSKAIRNEEVKKIIKYIGPTITSEILVSAYDLFYGDLKESQLSFATAIFVDSGGYEASEDADLSEVGKESGKPKPWTQKNYMEALTDGWKFKKPTILVSYDSPYSKTTVEKQIARGRKFFSKWPQANSTLLFKTERRSDQLVNIDAIIANKHHLKDFDIIAVTETELGKSTLERMVNIAKLRQALSSVELETPIHIFGSLDTISTPLYFIAGADIFDGLAWLRYAFCEGNTLYKHNYGAKKLGISFEDFGVNGKTWHDNYFYLHRLKEEMNKFLLDESFRHFTFIGDVLEGCYTQLKSSIKKGS